ncbi:MAG: cupin domain-containing protein [Candidatus Aenigmatarchaeota archaeon]
METKNIVSPPDSRRIKSRKVFLSPGEEVGEHVTEKREEVIIVLKGKVTLEKEDQEIQLHEGESYFISEGVKHNVKNESDEPLEYVYVVSLLD